MKWQKIIYFWHLVSIFFFNLNFLWLFSSLSLCQICEMNIVGGYPMATLFHIWKWKICHFKFCHNVKNPFYYLSFATTKNHLFSCLQHALGSQKIAKISHGEEKIWPTKYHLICVNRGSNAFSFLTLSKKLSDCAKAIVF